MAASLLSVCALLGCLTATLAQAATYYVDYDQGDDHRSGLSPAEAWKHCPGDGQAEGNADRTRPQAGDTMQFKSDVVYRGAITFDGRYVAGSPGSPIVVRGDGWGAGQAVLDGSETIAGPWQVCASPSACGGNPNYARIYYASVTNTAVFSQGFFDADDFLWYSQDPNPADPFHYDRTEYFRVLPAADPAIHQTRTSITDPRYFTQPDAAFWNGAYIAAWRIPNVTVIKKITGYDPATHTIYHEDLGGDVYTDRDSYYTVLNHPSLIDTPGEFFLDEAQGRLYVWPRRTPVADISMRALGTGLYANSVKHITIQGLIVQKFTMGIRAIDGGSGITPEGVVIRDNMVRLLKSNDWYAIQVGGQGMLVEGNTVQDCQRAVGILAGGDDVRVRRNHVRRASRQGIWFMGARDSTLWQNVVEECRGTHANGISVYSDSENIEVYGNRVSFSNIPFTMENSRNLNIINNVFDGNSLTGYLVAGWGGLTGILNLYHNTIVNSTNHASVYISGGGTENQVNLYNNILDGGGCGNRGYNLYTSLAWYQNSNHGWALAEGETLENDLSKIFLDPGAADYRLKPGSPALDRGTNVGVLQDLADVSRPQSGHWDMGAYEFFTGSTRREESLPADQLRLRWIFPHPAKGRTTFQFTTPTVVWVEVMIFNCVGEQAARLRGLVSPGQAGLVWDTVNLAPGVYYYHITAERTLVAKGKVALVGSRR